MLKSFELNQISCMVWMHFAGREQKDRGITKKKFQFADSVVDHSDNFQVDASSKSMTLKDRQGLRQVRTVT